MNGFDDGNRELESEAWLDRLEKLANQKAASSEHLSDLQIAASAAALIANARKEREDFKHRHYRLRLEEAKSWAFLAIPALLLCCLLAIAFGYGQRSRQMREAAADEQFHEAEKGFLAGVTQTGALSRPELLLLAAPLQRYATDPRFAEEVSDLSILALPHASSFDAFQDYFVSRGIHVNSRNLPSVLTLDRMLYTNFNELDDALNSDSTSNMSTIVGRPLSREQGQHARDAILLELTFLSGKIAAHMHSYGNSPLNADLRRVYFKGIDLGDVNFGKSNLEAWQLEGVSLTDADLSGVMEFDNSQWIDANWWEARSVSRPLLNYLVTNQYPYHPPVVDYTNAPASHDFYVQKVLKLCKMAGLSCDASSMPYGTPTKAEKHSK